MTHDLVPQAIKIKTTIFDPPARLINSNELCCAIAMAYRDVGFPEPDAAEGTDLKLFQEEALKRLDNSGVKPALQEVIESYIFNGVETVEKDAKIIMDLVYQ